MKCKRPCKVAIRRTLTFQLDEVKYCNWTHHKVTIGRCKRKPFIPVTPKARWSKHWPIRPRCWFTGLASAARPLWPAGSAVPGANDYISFDNDVARAAAEADPAGFVAGLPERVILDEVQRVPSLFTALKQEIDALRTPGRFLLTGSSQVLLVPALSDSLAGRMEIRRLHPLSQCEIQGGVPNFLDDLFDGAFRTVTSGRLGDELAVLMVAGGYPAALARPTAAAALTGTVTS